MRSDFKIKGGELCIEKIPSGCGVVIFGASGDLSFRKLLPSLFGLYSKKLLPENFYVLGCARSVMNDDSFREKIKLRLDSVKEKEALSDFLQHCHYVKIEYLEKASYSDLIKKVEKLDADFKTGQKAVFYMATPPSFYRDITSFVLSCADSPVIRKGDSWPRFVFEKPFCHDLESAITLDKELHARLEENQIYRIDHYLGKDTVQNLLMFRFANAIFEPLWNSRYIDHVQITVAESLGVGHRAGYFEQAGLLRDMFQNHILQMVAMVAMEPPSSFDADRIRDERAKILRSVRRYTKESLKHDVLRGQYTRGMVEGLEIPAYREEVHVDPESMIETFVCMKLFIDNWRWNGVPFYIRAGKRLKEKVSQIGVVFKPLPHSIFRELKPEDLVSNVLIFSIQPDEGVSLTIQAKQPGPKLCMHPLMMDFKYREVFGVVPPEAYERLILDCMLGDQTLFIRSDGMELAWSFLTPVLMNPPPLEFYEGGSWGPESANRLIQKDGREWLL